MLSRIPAVSLVDITGISVYNATLATMLKLSARPLIASVTLCTPVRNGPPLACPTLMINPSKALVSPIRSPFRLLTRVAACSCAVWVPVRDFVRSSSLLRLLTRIDAALIFSRPNSLTACAVERFFFDRFSSAVLSPTTEGLSVLSVPFSRLRITLRNPVPASPPLISRSANTWIAAFNCSKPIPACAAATPPFFIAAAVSAISDEPYLAPAAKTLM
ncbi:Uncharacterised protein [Serratia proteamaculans]|nr:Uncharacterised protein [Serratia proteamaculans]